MTRHARTRPIKVGPDDRCRVLLNLTPEEAREVESAATGLPVSVWCRWAVLSMARLVNGLRPAAPAMENRP